jgi:hypothetical protein
MGRYGWQEGNIKLPKAEFTRIRQAVADADTNEVQSVYDRSQEFWAGLTAREKSNPTAYQTALQAFRSKNTRMINSYDRVSTLPDGFDHAVGFDYNFSNPNLTSAHKPPKRVQKTDLRFPTSKTTEFAGADGDGQITFDRENQTVKWYVQDEKLDQHKSARTSSIGRALFAALPKVKWTRGTGGFITGNDDGNEDDHSNGGGANYVMDGFGPVGVVEARYQTEPYVMADGTRVNRGDFEDVAKVAAAAQKRKWKAEAAARDQGRRSGGQYDFKTQGGPEVRLTGWR